MPGDVRSQSGPTGEAVLTRNRELGVAQSTLRATGGTCRSNARVLHRHAHERFARAGTKRLV